MEIEVFVLSMRLCLFLETGVIYLFFFVVVVSVFLRAALA